MQLIRQEIVPLVLQVIVLQLPQHRGVVYILHRDLILLQHLLVLLAFLYSLSVPGELVSPELLIVAVGSSIGGVRPEAVVEVQVGLTGILPHRDVITQ
jgi:hypothetical protein